MKDYPQNTPQWADEAYQAMIDAWDTLTEGHPFPTENQKEKLIEIAAVMACENRDITESDFVKHALEHTKNEFKIDYDSRDIVAKVNFTLCFLLAYFDAHLSLQMIPQELADDAMAHLRSNFDLTYSGKNQTNVLSINYFEKS